MLNEQLSDKPVEDQGNQPSNGHDLAARTLAGDLRDLVIERLRDLRDPWHKLPESQQIYQAKRIEDDCTAWVREAVVLIAAREFAAIPATLKECKIKDGIEAKVVLSRYDENRHELIDASGSEILIILADAKAFLGARGPAKIDRQALVDAAPIEPEGEGAGPLFEQAPDAGGGGDLGESDTAAADPYARQAGYEDGFTGVRDHAARWAPGEPGHGDYWIGWIGGNRTRIEAAKEGAAEPAAVAEAEPELPKRRGRPRKADHDPGRRDTSL